jgi:hypothetical protein
MHHDNSPSRPFIPKQLIVRSRSRTLFKTDLSSSERLGNAVLDEKCFLPEDQLVDGP